MKLTIVVLAMGSLVMPLMTSGASLSGNATPQPRPRLQQLPQGPVAIVAKVVPVENTATSDGIVMAPVQVNETRPPESPVARKEVEPTRFSPVKGGPIMSGKLGELPVQVGLWPWFDLLATDAKYGPDRTLVKFEVVRIKF